MPENILFFDTETTGLPSFKFHPSAGNQPACLQMGAILATPSGEILEEYQTLIQIGDKPIHPKAFEAHGITPEKANSEGVLPVEAFVKFHELSLKADFLVCHNFSFDFFILRCMAHSIKEESIRELIEDLEEFPYKCTMRSTIKFCALPFPSGRKGHKFPKLEELYQILFDETFEGAHDAMADVTATQRCYFELVSREVM